MTRVAAVIHLLVPACRPGLHKWSCYLLIPCEWLLSWAVLSSDFPLVGNCVVVAYTLSLDGSLGRLEKRLLAHCPHCG